MKDELSLLAIREEPNGTSPVEICQNGSRAVHLGRVSIVTSRFLAKTYRNVAVKVDECATPNHFNVGRLSGSFIINVVDVG